MRPSISGTGTVTAGGNETPNQHEKWKWFNKKPFVDNFVKLVAGATVADGRGNGSTAAILQSLKSQSAVQWTSTARYTRL